MKGQVLPTWCLYEVSLPSSQSSRAFADSTQRWCSEAGFCVSAIDDEKCDRIHDVTKEGKKNLLNDGVNASKTFEWSHESEIRTALRAKLSKKLGYGGRSGYWVRRHNPAQRVKLAKVGNGMPDRERWWGDGLST